MLSSRWRQSKPGKTIRKKKFFPPRKVGGNFFRRRQLQNVVFRRIGEAKNFDITYSAVLSTTATITAVNLCAVGANEFNRVGRRIEMNYLKLNLWITPDNSNSTAPDVLRFLVVYDRQTNGALPAMSDILTDQDNTGAATNNALSSPNVDNRFRFGILMDKKIYLPDCKLGVLEPGNTPNIPNMFIINEFIKLKGAIAHYKTDNANIAAIATGGLYLVTQTYSTAVAGQNYTLFGSVRLNYHDM